jgi:hypothetical protein
MTKVSMSLILTLTAALLAALAFSQVSTVSAQQDGPVGIVVAYVPGQSITIVDQSGTQTEYRISPSLKIRPPGRADSVAIGSFVTIIAPASLDQGKQTAAGIVVHPQVPPGWKVPVMTTTPLETATAAETLTATPVGTIVLTDTATEPPPSTGTGSAVDTPTGTSTPNPMETATETLTPTATPSGGGTTATADGFIEWLRSLFQQILTSQ